MFLGQPDPPLGPHLQLACPLEPAFVWSATASLAPFVTLRGETILSDARFCLSERVGLAGGPRSLPMYRPAALRLCPRLSALAPAPAAAATPPCCPTRAAVLLLHPRRLRQLCGQQRRVCLAPVGLGARRLCGRARGGQNSAPALAGRCAARELQLRCATGAASCARNRRRRRGPHQLAVFSVETAAAAALLAADAACFPQALVPSRFLRWEQVPGESNGERGRAGGRQAEGLVGWMRC